MGASSCTGNMREMVKVWWLALKLKSFNLSWKVQVFPQYQRVGEADQHRPEQQHLHPESIENILYVKILHSDCTNYGTRRYYRSKYWLYHNLCSLRSQNMSQFSEFCQTQGKPLCQCHQKQRVSHGTCRSGMKIRLCSSYTEPQI